MKSYSTVFIDWAGTLSYSKFWNHWDNATHPNNRSFQQIQKIHFRGDSKKLSSWMRGEYTSEEILRFFAEESNIDYKHLFQEFIKSCKEMTFTSDKITDLLLALKNKNIRLVIATDNMDSFTRWTIPSLRLTDLFDDILNSSDLKVLKEDLNKYDKSILFEDYLKKHDIKKGESILIDDSEDLEQIVTKSGIHYLQVTKQRPLSYHLKHLFQQL